MDQEIIFKEFNNLLELKKFSELKKKATSYLKKNKNELFALEFLGVAHFSLKEFKLSAEIFRQAIILNSNSTSSLLHLARISNIFKDYQLANNYYDKIIKFDKNNYLCFVEYASFLIDQNKINLAISILNQAIAIQPQSFQALSLMGYLFLKAEKFITSISYFIKSIGINDKNYKDLCNLGFCYYKLEKIEKAKYFFQKAIEINSEFATAYSNLGLAYQTEGNFVEAIKNYEKCLSINERDYDTFRLLCMSTKLNIENSHVVRMKELYNTNISKNDKMLAGFGLAKVMEDNKIYKKASFYLDEANNLRRENFVNFDINAVQLQFDLIAKTFTSAFFSRNKTNHDYGITPIFILGMPRSGTTLAEQIISSHPKVRGCGEINDLTDSINEVFPEIDSQLMLNNITKANSNSFKDIGDKYISKLKKYSNDLFFTDKMPFNFKVIGLIKVCIPNAKIIHCYRNPNDNLLSIYKNYFSKEIMPWAYNKIELKKYYETYNKLMLHYKSVLGDFIFNLDYEILTKNPEAEIRKILTFCNLEWNNSCLNIEKNNKPIFTASINQARAKINTDSHYRWKEFENFFPDLFFKN